MYTRRYWNPKIIGVVLNLVLNLHALGHIANSQIPLVEVWFRPTPLKDPSLEGTFETRPENLRTPCEPSNNNKGKNSTCELLVNYLTTTRQRTTPTPHLMFYTDVRHLPTKQRKQRLPGTTNSTSFFSSDAVLHSLFNSVNIRSKASFLPSVLNSATGSACRKDMIARLTHTFSS